MLARRAGRQRESSSRLARRWPNGLFIGSRRTEARSFTAGGLALEGFPFGDAVRMVG